EKLDGTICQLERESSQGDAAHCRFPQLNTPLWPGERFVPVFENREPTGEEVKRMGDGDGGETTKFAVGCFDTEQEGSDEQCGAKCVAITRSVHGSVLSPLWGAWSMIRKCSRCTGSPPVQRPR
ncbi:hypothetical protein KUCAC02_029978, partial [Chaenocephalus aceratus]